MKTLSFGSVWRLAICKFSLYLLLVRARCRRHTERVCYRLRMFKYSTTKRLNIKYHRSTHNKCGREVFMLMQTMVCHMRCNNRTRTTMMRVFRKNRSNYCITLRTICKMHTRIAIRQVQNHRQNVSKAIFETNLMRARILSAKTIPIHQQHR